MAIDTPLPYSLTPEDLDLYCTPINVEDFSSTYTSLKNLGGGGYGTVWLVEHSNNKTLHAAKMINDATCYRETFCEKRQIMIPDEIFLWEQLAHPNLLDLHEIFYEGDTWIMILEYQPDFVDLFNFIAKVGPLHPKLARCILSQLLDVVFYLLSLGIDHRDLKDENILFNPATGEIRLIDFGSACLVTPDTVYTHFEGIEIYLPPEFYHHGKYRALDGTTWAVGCLAFVLLNGDAPFDTREHVKSYKSLNKNLEKLRLIYKNRL